MIAWSLTQHAAAALVPQELRHAGGVAQAQAGPRIRQHSVSQALLQHPPGHRHGLRYKGKQRLGRDQAREVYVTRTHKRPAGQEAYSGWLCLPALAAQAALLHSGTTP